MERHLLGDAVRRAAGRAGDVRAVAVAVVRAVAVTDEVGAVADPAAELLVGRADAGVDDVGLDAGPGLVVVVGVVQRQIALVDPVEPPRRGALRAVACMTWSGSTYATRESLAIDAAAAGLSRAAKPSSACW